MKKIDKDNEMEDSYTWRETTKRQKGNLADRHGTFFFVKMDRRDGQARESRSHRNLCCRMKLCCRTHHFSGRQRPYILPRYSRSGIPRRGKKKAPGLLSSGLDRSYIPADKSIHEVLKWQEVPVPVAVAVSAQPSGHRWDHAYRHHPSWSRLDRARSIHRPDVQRSWLGRISCQGRPAC